VAVASAVGTPCFQVDAFGDEANASVTASDVNPAGMIAACAEDSPATTSHVGDQALRWVVVRVAGPVFSTVDPSGTAMTGPAAMQSAAANVGFHLVRIFRQKEAGEPWRGRWHRATDESTGHVHHHSLSQMRFGWLGGILFGHAKQVFGESCGVAQSVGDRFEADLGVDPKDAIGRRA